MDQSSQKSSPVNPASTAAVFKVSQTRTWLVSKLNVFLLWRCPISIILLTLMLKEFTLNFVCSFECMGPAMANKPSTDRRWVGTTVAAADRFSWVRAIALSPFLLNTLDMADHACSMTPAVQRRFQLISLPRTQWHSMFAWPSSFTALPPIACSG